MKNDSKKSSVKIISKKLLIIGFAAFDLLVAFCALLAVVNQKNTIAFYGIEKEQTAAIKAEIEKFCTENNLKYEFEVYDSSKTLSSQIPLSGKPAVVITTSGFALDQALSRADKKAGADSSLTSEMTSTIRGITKHDKNGQITALPFLSDNLEIDIDLNEFRRSKISSITTLKDVESFLSFEKNSSQQFPIVFAGADGKQMLTILGALCEALEGSEAYAQAVSILEKGTESKFNPVKVAEALADNPDSPLITSIKLLNEWNGKGILSPNVFSLTANDVKAYVGQKVTPSAIMTLSQHRNCDSRTISRFSSIYVPSSLPPSSRSFSSQTVYAVPLKKGSDSSKILGMLVSSQKQEDLSRSTGLAPVLAHCRTPDKQADDVRFWVAATNAPNAGLGNEVFLTQDQARALGKELSSRIRK